MPTLPLTLPAAIDGGELPVRTDADVLAAFPVEVRVEEDAPVRDALVAALTAMAETYQIRSRQAVAQSDPTRATGVYLEGLADDAGVFAQANESTEQLRARLLGAPAIITPDAIIASVNAILAPYTTTKAKYFESEVDSWFVSDGTAEIESFVWEDTDESASPRYTDRLYPDDAAVNSGVSIANREVRGAWVFSDTFGRHFVVSIPPLDAVDNDGMFVFDGSSLDEDGAWIADGSDTSGAESDGSVTTFMAQDQGLADDLYAAIASTVANAKGQGIRWGVSIDPTLR
jgi:hypothetical protein